MDVSVIIGIAAVGVFVVLVVALLAWRVGRLSARVPAPVPVPVPSAAATPSRGPVVIAPVLVVNRRP